MTDERPLVDFSVEKPGKGIRLLVEAKNTTAGSPEWAARFLRNLFVHADVPRAEFFLLALRDHFYLWRNPAPDGATPDFEADTAAALDPYLSRLRGRNLGNLSQSSFEMLIQAWLADLVSGTLPEAVDDGWLEESGLAESVRDGAIRSNIAA